MASLGVQLRVMDSDPRRMDVVWPLAVWIWAGSPGQVGGKLLTENIQGEWVTTTSNHWVPSLTLIGSVSFLVTRCIVRVLFSRDSSSLVLAGRLFLFTDHRKLVLRV